ncbi:hypothetical protein LguiA_026003 [Lonicera macranthoides]
MTIPKVNWQILLPLWEVSWKRTNLEELIELDLQVLGITTLGERDNTKIYFHFCCRVHIAFKDLLFPLLRKKQFRML